MIERNLDNFSASTALEKGRENKGTEIKLNSMILNPSRSEQEENKHIHHTEGVSR